MSAAAPGFLATRPRPFLFLPSTAESCRDSYTHSFDTIPDGARVNHCSAPPFSLPTPKWPTLDATSQDLGARAL